MEDNKFVMYTGREGALYTIKAFLLHFNPTNVKVDEEAEEILEYIIENPNEENMFGITPYEKG